MARLAAIEYEADRVINTDADEFWWPATGSLADTFATVPGQYGQVGALRNSFLSRPDGDELPFHQRMVIRDRPRET